MPDDSYPPDVEPLRDGHEFFVDLCDLVDEYSYEIDREPEELLYDIKSFHDGWMETLSATGALWRNAGVPKYPERIFVVIRDCEDTPIMEHDVKEIEGELVLEEVIQSHNDCELCDNPRGGTYAIRGSTEGIPYCRSCLEDEWYVEGIAESVKELVENWL